MCRGDRGDRGDDGLRRRFLLHAGDFGDKNRPPVSAIGVIRDASRLDASALCVENRICASSRDVRVATRAGSSRSMFRVPRLFLPSVFSVSIRRSSRPRQYVSRRLVTSARFALGLIVAKARLSFTRLMAKSSNWAGSQFRINSMLVSTGRFSASILAWRSSSCSERCQVSTFVSKFSYSPESAIQAQRGAFHTCLSGVVSRYLLTLFASSIEPKAPPILMESELFILPSSRGKELFC